MQVRSLAELDEASTGIFMNDGNFTFLAGECFRYMVCSAPAGLCNIRKSPILRSEIYCCLRGGESGGGGGRSAGTYF